MLKMLITSIISAVIGLILGWCGQLLFAPTANTFVLLIICAIIGFVCSALSQLYIGSSMKKAMAKAQG